MINDGRKRKLTQMKYTVLLAVFICPLSISLFLSLFLFLSFSIIYAGLFSMIKKEGKKNREASYDTPTYIVM
jgi:predicted membrane protein